MPDVVATLGGGKARQTRTQEGPERVDGATAGLTDNRFEFGEAEFDGVEVGAVGRQEPQRRAGGCNGGLQPVGGELLLSPQSVEIIKFGDPGSGR